MISLIIIGLIWIGLIVLLWITEPYDPATPLVIGGCFGGVVLFSLWLLICPFTGGLNDNYGKIEQVGYLTNLSERGVIYKTYEGVLQKGVGEQATAENSFKFSTTDAGVIAQLKGLVGSKQRIKLICRQWLIMPYKYGDTDREVRSVIIL